MAQIVGIYAATHTPVLLNFPDQVSAEDREHVYEAFKHLGSRLTASEADAVVVVSDDHLHNFFLDNLPAFWNGFLTTLYLSLTAGIISLFLGILLAAMRVSPLSTLRWVSTAWVEVMRNTSVPSSEISSFWERRFCMNASSLARVSPAETMI